MLPYETAESAVARIRSNQRVFVHGMSAAPQTLIQALTARYEVLEGVEMIHLHTEGDAPYAAPECAKAFFTNCLFIGANVRSAVHEGRGDYVPVFLSEVPNLFRRRILPLDVAMVQVSPPDKHGFCTLGVSVDASLAAVESANTVIAEVNPHMPRTHGDGNIHVSRFAALVNVDYKLPGHAAPKPEPADTQIARLVATLIEDGATLQMGIGGIPNAVLAELKNHRRLGIHTEMFSDGVVDLVESGVITNEEKKIHPGKIVAGFINGSQRLYDFVDDNPSVMLRDISFVNDTAVIREMPKMTAINSAVEIDLTGQVCADSIGDKIFSGVGGQMDFVRGASLAEGGKPIIALPSRTKKGVSRIVHHLKPGAGVVTTRAHVHYVVTEFGIAELYGRNLTQRAKALIAVAHPDDREELEKAAFYRS